MGCVTIHRRPEGWHVKFQRDMPGDDTAHTARLVSLLYDREKCAVSSDHDHIRLFKDIIRRVRVAEAAASSDEWTTALRDMRTELGLSQAYVAKVSGVDHSTVSRWESGNTLPSARDLSRLVRFYALLGIDFDPFKADRESTT